MPKNHSAIIKPGYCVRTEFVIKTLGVSGVIYKYLICACILHITKVLFMFDSTNYYEFAQCWGMLQYKPVETLTLITYN